MAMLILHAALTALVLGLLVLVYQLSIAVVAHRSGIEVEEVGVGFGPTVLRWRGRAWEWKLALIPAGGYTKMRNDPEAASPGSLEGASPGTRIPVLLAGPLSNLLLALLLLGLPVWLGAPQLRATSPARSTITPCAVPGLTIADRASSWSGQARAFREIPVEWFRRLVLFGDMREWGGYVGCLITVGAVGRVSAMALVTCWGLVAAWMALVNLLPLPNLIGFQVLETLWELTLGRPVREATRGALSYVGFLVAMVILVRLVVIDLRWLF